MEISSSSDSERSLLSYLGEDKSDTDHSADEERREEALYLPKRFRMEGMSDVIQLLIKGDYLIKIDLTDAFLSVPRSQRKLT